MSFYGVRSEDFKRVLWTILKVRQKGEQQGQVPAGAMKPTLQRVLPNGTRRLKGAFSQSRSPV